MARQNNGRNSRQRSRQVSRASRGPTQRQLRAGELVRHALAEVLTREEIHHEDLADVAITVTEVGMSHDLQQATCYIMPLGGKDTDKVLKALHKTGPWLSGQVAKRVNLRFTPHLKFRVDSSFDNADHIQKLLRRDDVAPDLMDDQDAADPKAADPEAANLKDADLKATDLKATDLKDGDDGA